MPRRVGERGAADRLDLLARVHHHDVVAHRPDRVQVMADEHVRNAQVAPQLRQQVEDRRADHGVQRRGDLVAQDQVGLGREGPRQVDALLLPAGQAGWTALGAGRRQLHQVQQLDDAAIQCLALQAPVQLQRPRQDLAQSCATGSTPCRPSETRSGRGAILPRCDAGRPCRAACRRTGSARWPASPTLPRRAQGWSCPNPTPRSRRWPGPDKGAG